MKINYPQLEQQISKNLSANYIISGEELLLKQDAIYLIRKAATKAGFSERIRLHQKPDLIGKIFILFYIPILY